MEHQAPEGFEIHKNYYLIRIEVTLVDGDDGDGDEEEDDDDGVSDEDNSVNETSSSQGELPATGQNSRFALPILGFGFITLAVTLKKRHYKFKK